MIFQSLADRLLDYLGRMMLMELEDLNKLTDPGPIGLPALQFGQQLFIDRRPTGPPP